MSGAAAERSEVRTSPARIIDAEGAHGSESEMPMLPGSVELGGKGDVRAETMPRAHPVPSAGIDLCYWMERYQQADQNAPAVLIAAVSPGLLRFFRSQGASREYAEDLLQDTWLRIHRVRHTYRPGAPLLPWVYAIARHVRVDQYRRNRRITWHELQLKTLPEPLALQRSSESVPDFDTLVATLPAAQREVVTMLKVDGMTVEDVARATSSTVGAVKQKAHRAYQRLRDLLSRQTASSDLQDKL